MDSRKTVALALAVMMVVVVFSATVPLESEGVDGATPISSDDLLNLITIDENKTATLTLTTDCLVNSTGNNFYFYNFDKEFSELVIDGGNHTLYGEIWFNSYDKNPSHAPANYKVTIKDLTLNGDLGNDTYIPYGIVSMDQNPNPDNTAPTPINLTMIDCVVQNYSHKGIYLTSVSNLDIDNLTIRNCAFTPGYNTGATSPTDPTFQYYTSGDYAIDIDITGMVGTTIDINDVEFVERCGYLAAMKIAQRGGTGDSDKGTASIESVNLSNLNFTACKTESGKDILIGSEPAYNAENQSEGLRSYNSSFPVNFTAMTPTTLSYWGDELTPENNLSFDLSADAHLSVSASPAKGEAGSSTGSVGITLDRGSATASGKLGTNMSLTAGSGTSIAFVDFQNTGGNTIRIESGADYSGDAGDNVYVEPTPTPGYDDEELPPFVPTQPAEDDNTVTIVACAAAAAVAAILAVFLVIDRKP